MYKLMKNYLKYDESKNDYTFDDGRTLIDQKVIGTFKTFEGAYKAAIDFAKEDVAYKYMEERFKNTVKYGWSGRICKRRKGLLKDGTIEEEYFIIEA